MEIKPISLELSEQIKKYIEMQEFYKELFEEEFIKYFAIPKERFDNLIENKKPQTN